MTYTRRRFLHGTAAAVTGTLVSTSVPSHSVQAMSVRPGTFKTRSFQPPPPLQDSRFRQLIQTAIDAAQSAGASYADARLTFTQNLGFNGTRIPDRDETMGFGVRALVQGYWGFAASPVWNSTEAARLGRAAVEQARANVLGEPREIELAPVTDAVSGEWAMPVRDDPFEMSFDEICDFMLGLSSFILRLHRVTGYYIRSDFLRQQKVFGSSSGQLTVQRMYRTSGVVTFTLTTPERRSTNVLLDCLTPAGMGFEYLRDQPLRRAIVAAHEEGLKDLELPVRPIDVGRYSMLINSQGAAHLVGQTIGVATEIDRALGYEANAGGTSYIVDPLEMLGAYRVGAPLLTVTADRHGAGSVGRVKWDDEGVAPMQFDVVKNGVLMNMQTSREGAGWVKPRLLATGAPFASLGCAYTPNAIEAPLTHSADLTLQPSTATSAGLDELRQEIERGIELRAPRISTDFQHSSGLCRGQCYEIKRGKRLAVLANTGVLFRTTELWSNLVRLGGASSVRRFGLEERKGEPSQLSYHSVSAPPMVVKDMTFIDVTRKA